MARILVVENDAGVVDVLRRALSDWGHDVWLAHDGVEGHEAIFTRREDFDVLLSDLHMPRMSGPAFLERVAGEVRGRTPVVIISGKMHMIEALGEVRRWAFALLQKPFEIEHLRETLEHALEQRRLLLRLAEADEQTEALHRRLEFLARQNAELFEAGRHDPQTGLPSRLRLREDLGARVASTGGRVVLALCDIDDFRRFNTKLGYAGGDAAIKAVSELLRRHSRPLDGVYRYGGDEFVVLLDCDHLDQGAEIMERLRSSIESAAPTLPGLDSQPITISAGVARIDGLQRPALEECLDEANRLLTYAKRQGGNRVATRPIGEPT